MRIQNSIDKTINRVNKMIKYESSEDCVAWYLLMNTKIPKWEQAKDIAREMRNEYDKDRKNEKKNENTE